MENLPSNWFQNAPAPKVEASSRGIVELAPVEALSAGEMVLPMLMRAGGKPERLGGVW